MKYRFLFGATALGAVLAGSHFFNHTHAQSVNPAVGVASDLVQQQGTAEAAKKAKKAREAIANAEATSATSAKKPAPKNSVEEKKGNAAVTVQPPSSPDPKHKNSASSYSGAPATMARQGNHLAKFSPEEKRKVIESLTAIAHRMDVLSHEFPTPSVGAPNANGGAGVVGFASLGYVNHWDGTTNPDGNAGVGMSFGDPRNAIGALVSMNIDSLGLQSDPFAGNGGFGFRLNRYVADYTAVALGANNIVGWGSFAPMSKSYYAVVTQGVPLKKFPITLNAGLGTGSFNSVADASSGTDHNIQPFAGIGVLLYKGLSLSGDWAMQQYNVGMTYGFKLGIPFFVSVAEMNVFNEHGNTSHLQLSGGAAYVFSA